MPPSVVDPAIHDTAIEFGWSFFSVPCRLEIDNGLWLSRFTFEKDLAEEGGRDGIRRGGVDRWADIETSDQFKS